MKNHYNNHWRQFCHQNVHLNSLSSLFGKGNKIQLHNYCRFIFQQHYNVICECVSLISICCCLMKNCESSLVLSFGKSVVNDNHHHHVCMCIFSNFFLHCLLISIVTLLTAHAKSIISEFILQGFHNKPKRLSIFPSRIIVVFPFRKKKKLIIIILFGF